MTRVGRVLVAALVVTGTSVWAQSVGDTETGLAAVYADSLNGHATASGQTYDRSKLTAAHTRLPFGTMIRVTNRSNGRSVIVRVNDRGPLRAGRILDISPAAADRLGFSRGIRHVTLEVVEVGTSVRASRPLK
jgi:rare lipoprotein A